MFVKCRVFREFNLHIRTVNATFFCGGRKAGYLAREILCRASVSFRSESVTSVFGREWGGGRKEGGGEETDQYTLSRVYFKDHRSLYDDSPTPTSLVP